VEKTIGDTRRTRVDPTIEDEAAARAAARATCDEGTLRGTYQFFDQGVDAEGNSLGGAGYEYFDGNGNIYGVFSHHDHGASSAHYLPYNATYTVNADCTGRSIYPVFDSEYDLFIDPHGHRFTWVLTEPAESEGVSGVEERVTRQRIGILEPLSPG
jgi:hypothetical protein